MITAVLLIALAPVRVGSKQFTESVLLGELARQTLEQSGVPAVHRRELGGTRVLWEALVAGQIDVYPEYTGTLAQEILSGAPLDEGLRARGIRAGPPLGFEDTYAIGVRRDSAVPDRVEQLRKPVSGLQITLLQTATPGGRQHVLDQRRLAMSRDAGSVRLLVPGQQVGTVGKPVSTWLRCRMSSK